MRIIYSLAVLVLLASCNIDQKKEAKLPDVDVDVDVEEGQLPTFDIDWADIDVGTTTKTVEVPKVVIVMEEEEIEVPYLDVDMPDDMDGEKEELNLMVEAEVTDFEHRIDIKEVIATKNNLYVIAELEKTSTSIDGKKMRVSDQIMMNGPDLNVKYIIVGERPDRVFNSRYKYVRNLNDFKNTLKNTRTIYSD